MPNHTSGAEVSDINASISIPISSSRTFVDWSLATSTTVVKGLSWFTSNSVTFFSIPNESFFALGLIETFSVLFELTLRANTETVLEDVSIVTFNGACLSVPLGSDWTLTCQVGSAPNSRSGTGDTAHSVPVGVGWAFNALSSIPVSFNTSAVVD